MCQVLAGHSSIAQQQPHSELSNLVIYYIDSFNAEVEMSRIVNVTVLKCVIIAYRILEWTWEDAYKGVGFVADIDSVSMGSINFLLLSNRNGYLGRHTYYRYSKISSPLVWPLVSDSCVNLRVHELVRERLLM